MNKLNNKSGFTLIEIIVVLIIVGILAAIALPNLFSNVEKSRAAEGLGVLSGLKTTVESCVQANYTTAAADCAWTTLALTSAQGNFLYTYVTAPSNSSYAYALRATSVADSADTLTITRDTATGQYTCTGASSFAGAC